MTQLSPPTAAAPQRGRLRVLIAVNALLAGLVLMALVTPWAGAQGPGSRARGNYLMVSGRATGVSGSVVYIVDSVNQELVGLRYQQGAGRLEPFGYRNLAGDSSQGSRSR